jgi:hypothetical protein
MTRPWPDFDSTAVSPAPATSCVLVPNCDASPSRGAGKIGALSGAIPRNRWWGEGLAGDGIDPGGLCGSGPQPRHATRRIVEVIRTVAA